jgi:2'-5' RNA ligase
MSNRGDEVEQLEMVEERLAYGLAAYPPAGVQQQLRRELDERGVGYPHRFHLTLKYAFVPTDRSSCTFTALSEVIASSPPLRLRSSGRLVSEDTLCHLLLIEQSPELMRLHEKLAALLTPAGRLLSPDTGRFEGVGYNPHITIAYGSTIDEFRHYTELLAGYEPQIAFDVSTIELSCFQPGRPDPIRSAAQTFLLGRPLPASPS